jgi:hypothetical protein
MSNLVSIATNGTYQYIHDENKPKAIQPIRSSFQ